jgi:hypothetical protein
MVDRYKEASEGDKADFRGYLTDYVRLYAFLSRRSTCFRIMNMAMAVLG